MTVFQFQSTIAEALAALCVCGGVGLVAQRIIGLWIKPDYYSGR